MSEKHLHYIQFSVCNASFFHSSCSRRVFLLVHLTAVHRVVHHNILCERQEKTYPIDSHVLAVGLGFLTLDRFVVPQRRID